MNLLGMACTTKSSRFCIYPQQIDATKKFLVRPNFESASQENCTLSDECRIQTGISEEDINAAKTLDQVLEEVQSHCPVRNCGLIKPIDFIERWNFLHVAVIVNL